MEVHHPHHPTHKKKWSEYIIEFVMLFAAVTLGFFAENMREDLLIQHHTKSVLAQLKHELILDTLSLKDTEKFLNKLDTVSEFIEFYIKQNKLEEHKASFYLLHKFHLFNPKFRSNNLALEQLKYTGALKNVMDDSLRMDIETYNQQINRINVINNRIDDYMDTYGAEISTYPFDLNRQDDRKVKNLASEKGEIITKKDVFCDNIKINLGFQPTFIPDKIILKSFDKKKYLNVIFKLNQQRNFALQRLYIPAYKTAVTLIRRLEKAYPDIEEKH